ncbi:MAG: hypothetical protein ACR2HG_06760 [Pyrinomonadaceae bacterium]
MKCQQRFIRTLAAITLGIAAVSFSLTGINESTTHSKLQTSSLSDFRSETYAPPSPAVFSISEISRTTSRPLAYLFQILFLLFIISPPIIALMLFLIWKELKKRNEMK